MHRTRRRSGGLASDISITFLANAISLVLGALSVLIMPKFLSETQYGYYQLYQFYVSYGTLLALGIPEGIYLLVGARGETRLSSKDIKGFFLIQCVLDALLYLMAFGLALSSSQGAEITTVVATCCVSGFISCVRLIVYYILQTNGQVVRYAKATILERIISLPPVLFAVVGGVADITPLLTFDAIGRFAAFVYAMFGVDFAKCGVRRMPWRHLIRQVPELAVTGGQVLISRYTDTLISGTVRYGVQSMWGIGAFAHVSLTMSLINMFMRLADAVAVPVFPALRRLDENGEARFYREASFCITILIGFGVLLLFPAIILLSSWIPLYAEALSYAVLLAPMCLAQCKISVLTSNFYKSLRFERALMIVNVASVAVAALCVFVALYSGRSLIAALIVIDVASTGRLFALEACLFHRTRIPDLKMILFDAILSVSMVLFYLLSGNIGIVIYVSTLLAILVASRSEVSRLSRRLLQIVMRKV